MTKEGEFTLLECSVTALLLATFVNECVSSVKFVLSGSKKA